MPAARPPAILDHLSALADTTRSRILLLLDRHELTVSELCGIMQLPQSTVSRHLKALADSGWISARAEGTSNVYAMTRDDLDRPHAGYGRWSASRSDPRRRRCTISGARRRCSPSAARNHRNSSRRPPASGIACATSCSAIAFISLLFRRSRTPEWTVGDLGCGTGQMTAALAPFVRPRHRRRRICRHASGGEEATARFRERRAPARRPRGASDRRWAARCGDAGARAASPARARARARRSRARAEAAAAGC